MRPPQSSSPPQIRRRWRDMRRQRAAIRRRRIVAGGLLAGGFAIAAYIALSLTVLAPVDTHGARVIHLTVHSKAVGEYLGLDVVVPAGKERRRPLLVFLHGRNGSPSNSTDDEAMFEGLAKLGAHAPIIAFPSGKASYWHNRDDGDWGDYVMDEVIPLAAREGDADPHRVAIGGISMGGFGAYDLALQNPGRFCAVGGHSPALWLEGGASAPGAFDDAEDFERHDVIARVREDPGAFGAIPIWNDAGKEDPFLISDVALDEALEGGGADLTDHIWPGGHERSYWDKHWGAYLRFYSRALGHCAT